MEAVVLMPAAETPWAVSLAPVYLDTPVMDLPAQVSQLQQTNVFNLGIVFLKNVHTSKALRYGTRSQEISQIYLHTPRSSAN